MCLDLHLHHLKCAAKHAAEYVGVPQLVLGASVVGQFDKIGKGVLLKDERKLLAVTRPIRDRGCYIEEDLEADLPAIIWLANSRGLFSPTRIDLALVRTLEIISAVSRKLAQRFIVLDLAK